MAIGKTNALKKGVDTSDATATSVDILLGKTAYANDEKIVGTIPTYNNEHENGYVPTRSMKLFLDQTKTCFQLFYNYKGTTIEDGTLEFSDTSNVTNMERMFYGSVNLTTIPQLDTSNVTDMSVMFNSCHNLTTIPLLNTSNVTNMSYMFNSCHNLTTIPLLNTSNVTNMSYMFKSCNNLTTIPQLDTSKVTDMSSIFSSCRNLKSVLMTNIGVNLDISASTQFERSDLVTILNNLATVTSSKTLTMGATNLAKLTDADKAIATNKGWTLA